MRLAEPFAITLASALALSACSMNNTPERPEVHGHRGCRGLLPENSLPAFLKAAELGVDWLEMDVVISADGEVIVSHEPWMDHRICRTEEGDGIPAAEEQNHNLYRMTVQEIRAFDCGSVRHPDFPEQMPSETYKPTLAEVVENVEQEAMMYGWGVQSFNIEIKSDPAHYGTMQPQPEEFARIVLDRISALGITERCLIQSFDPAVLRAVRELAEDVPVALLVEHAGDMANDLERLGFNPDYYSAEFTSVDAVLVAALRARDIEPLVWTVNTTDDMRRMIALGVNGIITDHPERLIAILDETY